MKITNDKIAAMVKSVLRGGTAHRSHDLIHPEREWLLGIACFLLLAIGAGWWAASVYVRFVDPSSLMSTEPTTETATFRPAQIEAALLALTTRAERYQVAEAALRGGERTTPSVAVPEDASVATSSEAVAEPISSETEVPASTTDTSQSSDAMPGDEVAEGEPTLAF